ncbi:4013_t:CDS:2, partial [Gigaspora rosea]
LFLDDSSTCTMRCRKGLQGADYIFEGESRSGAQDMETNAALVIPKHKDDEFEIHSGSQSHSSIQEKVAEVLGIENNKVATAWCIHIHRFSTYYQPPLEYRQSLLGYAVWSADISPGVVLDCLFGSDGLESILNEVTENMNIEVTELRLYNLYNTPYNQTLENWYLPSVYQKVKETSDHTILRIDLCMDIGKYSGQIVGAFVQGAEWFTIEENLHFPNGYLHIKGPKTINSWG